MSSTPSKHRRRLTSGMRFHRLTLVRFSHYHTQPSGQRRLVYECLCDCGKVTNVLGCNLTGKHPTKSCGCLNDEAFKMRTRTHGMSKTPTFKIWANVVARGTGAEARANYYDRGIRVCERWMKFENFYADMGDRPEGCSIDRIDNNGPYSPENCRWATSRQQARNTRRTFRIPFEGKTMAISDVAEQIGISRSTLHQRLTTLGWSVERAINTPLHSRTPIV